MDSEDDIDKVSEENEVWELDRGYPGYTENAVWGWKRAELKANGMSLRGFEGVGYAGVAWKQVVALRWDMGTKPNSWATKKTFILTSAGTSK